MSEGEIEQQNDDGQYSDEGSSLSVVPQPQQPVARPEWSHDVSDFTTGRLMVGHEEEIRELFGRDTARHLAEDRRSWAIRLHGSGIGHNVADSLKVAEMIAQLAKATRWIGNSLFPDAPGVAPGLSLARAGNSVVLHFTTGLTEEPAAVVDDTAEQFASVEGGRYLALLLANSTDRAALEQYLAPLGRRAVQTYTTTLDTLVDSEIGVNTLVQLPGDGPRRRPQPVRVDLSVEQAVDDLAFLKHQPKMRRHTVEVEGIIYSQNDRTRRFSIESAKTGETLSGTYPEAIADELGRVWRRKVRAYIRVVEPEFPWLPRAGNTTRTLQAVERI